MNAKQGNQHIMLAIAIDFVTCKSKELSTLISSSFRRLNFIVIVFCNNVVVFFKCSLNLADAPSIKLSTTRYNFTEGTDMTLLCESDGFPAPTVTWSKIGGVSNFSYPSGQRLIIRNINRTEAGTYRCTASNGIGKPALHVMHVNVFCKFTTLSYITTDTKSFILNG